MNRRFPMDEASQLREENEQLTELLEAACMVFSTLELAPAIDSMLKSAQEITRANITSLALLDEETGTLNAYAQRGLNRKVTGPAQLLPRKRSVVETVLKKKKIHLLSQRAAQKFFMKRFQSTRKIGTTACVPLIFEGKILGILFVDDFKPREFSMGEKRALTVLATFAATAINHAKIHELSQQLARTDGLTNLYNYRYFNERLEEEIQRADRYSRALSLIMVDVDNFKQFNDTYGHIVGDDILKSIAGIIRQSMRDVDLASRYGGEEFTILLPETDTHDALPVAERIRRNVEKQTFGVPGIRSKLGAKVSMGIASFPKDVRNKKDLLRRADEAMYAAKAQGKNRVVTSTQL